VRADPWLAHARLNLALDHVDAQLGGPLATEDLARAVDWSVSSLHRAFVDVLDCAPATYVRLRRLDHAATLLCLHPRMRLADVADACGFGAIEVFCRAFLKQFGITAATWRDGGHRPWREARLREHAASASAARPLQAHRPWALRDSIPGRRLWYTLDFQPRSAQPNEFDVRIVDVPPCRIVYSRAVGTYGNADALWQQHLRWCESLGLVQPSTPVLATWLDDPSVTPVHRCRHDVGIVVPPAFEVRHAPSRIVPGGPRAVLDFHGPVDELPYAWQWLAHAWMPRHARKPMVVTPYLLLRAGDLPALSSHPPLDAQLCFSLGAARNT
jgi:AraC family transcriptional regulator